MGDVGGVYEGGGSANEPGPLLATAERSLSQLKEVVACSRGRKDAENDCTRSDVSILK